jgi:hypothetical protein
VVLALSLGLARPAGTQLKLAIRGWGSASLFAHCHKLFSYIQRPLGKHAEIMARQATEWGSSLSVKHEQAALGH